MRIFSWDPSVSRLGGRRAWVKIIVIAAQRQALPRKSGRLDKAHRREARSRKRRGHGMTAIGAVGDSVGPGIGLLDRRRIIAGPGFNRWLVPPAALAIHLCIGMAYVFSVFWLPLSKALGHDKSIECPGMPLFQALVTTSCDWRISDLVWIYTLFFVLLGLSAATWGGWLERAGPRKAGIVSAFCWCGGLGRGPVCVVPHQPLGML